MSTIPSYAPSLSGLPGLNTELRHPFGVDGSGEIATTTYLVEQAEAHLLSLLLTKPGERIMRPTYGVDVLQYLWSDADPVVVNEIAQSLKTQVAIFAPEMTIVSVNPMPNSLPGVLSIQVEYQLLTQERVNKTFSFGSGGLITA